MSFNDTNTRTPETGGAIYFKLILVAWFVYLNYSEEIFYDIETSTVSRFCGGPLATVLEQSQKRLTIGAKRPALQDVQRAHLYKANNSAP